MPILSYEQIDQQVNSAKKAIASSPSAAAASSDVASTSQDSANIAQPADANQSALERFGNSGSGVAGTLGAAVTGFNAGVEDTTLGLPQFIGIAGDKSGEKFVSTYEQIKENELAQAYNNHPITTAIGRGVGIVASSIPAGLVGGAGATTLLDRAAVSAGQFGALGFVSKAEDFNDRLGNTAGGIVGGAVGQPIAEGVVAIPGAVKASVQKFKNIKAALGAAYKSPDEVVKGALELTAKRTGGDLSKATFQDVSDDVNSIIQTQVKPAYDGNYSALNEAAAEINLMVPKPGLKSYIEDISENMGAGVLKKKLLSSASLYYDNGKVLTYDQAAKQMVEIGNSAAEAMRNNPTLGKALYKIKDVLQQDMLEAANSSGNPIIAQLATAANDFAKDVYFPMLNPANQLAILTQKAGGSFTSGLKNFLLTEPTAKVLINKAPIETQQNLDLAVVTALKNGKDSPTQFAATLQQNMQKNPQLFGQAAKAVPALISILEGSAMAAKNAPHNLSGWAGLMVGLGLDASGVTGGMATLSQMVYKAHALNTAGRMLRNGESAMMLKQFTTAQERGAAEPILTAIANKVVKTFKRFAEADPPNFNVGLSTKVANAPWKSNPETWYHGTPNKNLNVPTIQGKSQEISLTNNSNFSSVYAGDSGKVLKLTTSPEAKILDLTSTPGRNISNEELIKQGYHGVKYKDSAKPGAQTLLRVIKDGYLNSIKD